MADNLIQQTIDSSKPTSLDGYYNYIDPKVKANEFDTPLSALGFILKKDPNNIYQYSGDPLKEYTTAHEFEHTQQRKSWNQDSSESYKTQPDLQSLWDLDKKLYKFYPKFPKNDYYETSSLEFLQMQHRKYNEFMADLSALYHTHQDSETRGKIEDVLKSSPAYNRISKDLYPTIPHMIEDKTNIEWHKPETALSKIRSWIRNKTAY